MQELGISSDEAHEREGSLPLSFLSFFRARALSFLVSIFLSSSVQRESTRSDYWLRCPLPRSFISILLLFRLGDKEERGESQGGWVAERISPAAIYIEIWASAKSHDKWFRGGNIEQFGLCTFIYCFCFVQIVELYCYVRAFLYRVDKF